MLIVVAGLALHGTATGQPYINLGPSDGLALDQPRGGVRWLDGDQSIGPDTSNSFLFDTGANSIVVFGQKASELKSHGYQIEGTYEEQGVGGFVTYDVSAPYGFQFAGSDYVERTLYGVRALSSQTDYPPSVGSFMGIAGMPTMVNRVTTLGYSGWSGGVLPDFSNLLMEVAFSQTLPSNPGHRYSVPVTPIPFGPNGEEPLPVWAPVPFVTATAQLGSTRRSGGFLFDTGAQMSMLSSTLGISVGLDSNDDGVLDTLDDNYIRTEIVGGIGDPMEVPVFQIDSLRLDTSEGVELVWTNVELIILDIDPAIEGIVGSDLLTSGWLGALFYGEADGYFNEVQLDFRHMMDAENPSGTIYFDLNPDLDQVIIPVVPGDANGDDRVGEADAATLAANWGTSVTGGPADADFNGDGVVDAKDASILAANWGYTVPIPGDANGDGQVDEADAATLAANWGTSVTGGAADADFNGDGVVDAKDASILAAHWSDGPAAAAAATGVPEPTTLVLLLGLSLLLPLRHRRT